MTGAERRLCEQAKRVYGPFSAVRHGHMGWAAGSELGGGGVWASRREHLSEILRDMPSDTTGWRAWVPLLRARP